MRSSQLRRSHAEAMKRLVLRRPHPARLALLVLKGASARFGIGLGWHPAPILATVMATRRCNLKCPFCNAAGKNGSPPGDQAQLLPLVAELADAGVNAVGFTGGEPLLHADIEKAIALASRRGMVTHLNTNGTLLDREKARPLLDSGLDSVNISIDGASETVHDCLRGKGSFRLALRGADALVRERDASRSGTRIRFVMAMGKENSDEAVRLLELGEAAGVDGCSFLPVHGESCRPAASTASKAASSLLDRKASPLLDNSKRYIAGIRDFFEGKAMPLRCSASRTSIVIDPENRIYPCVPAAAAGGTTASWKGGDLMEIFRSPSFSKPAGPELCSACWWNCHRELDITLGIL